MKWHLVEFVIDLTADFEHRGEVKRVRIEKGSQYLTTVNPYVKETQNGPVEVADLSLEDGTLFKALPYQYFRFVDLYESCQYS